MLVRLAFRSSSANIFMFADILEYIPGRLQLVAICDGNLESEFILDCHDYFHLKIEHFESDHLNMSFVYQRIRVKIIRNDK